MFIVLFFFFFFFGLSSCTRMIYILYVWLCYNFIVDPCLSCNSLTIPPRSETTLNYWMMVERYPNLKEEVGNLFLGCEISSLLDINHVRWSTASCAFALAYRCLLPRKETMLPNTTPCQHTEIRGKFSLTIAVNYNKYSVNFQCSADICPGRTGG